MRGRYLLTGFFILVEGVLLGVAWSYLTQTPSWIRITAWVAGSIGLFVALWLLFYRPMWRREAPPSGWVTPLNVFPPAGEIAFVTLATWLALTGAFAFGTYLFDRERLEARLEPNETKRHAYLEATNQYAWHAASVIPFVNATDTLKWTEPSTHWKGPNDASAGYSQGTGVLLLIYKLLVLAPIVAAGRLVWVEARARREGA